MASEILTQNGIDPKEELMELGGLGNGDEEIKAKENHANRMVNQTCMMHGLYEAADNPSINFVYNLPGASAKYNPNGNIVKLTYASFKTNLTLFFDLIHEGLHAFDFNTSTHIKYLSGTPDLTPQSLNMIESRAWKTQIYFGDNRSNTINQFDRYYSRLSKQDQAKINNWKIGDLYKSLTK